MAGRTPGERAADDALALQPTVAADETANGARVRTVTFTRRVFGRPVDETAAKTDFDLLRDAGVSRVKAYRLGMSDDPTAAAELIGWKAGR